MSTTTQTHTPGPWEVQEEGSNALGFKIYVIIGPQSAIARVYTAFEAEEPGLAEANARLIAAAPNLLRALEDLKKELWTANLKLNVRKHFSLMAADAAAGTAIHKAKGGK